MAQLDEIFAAQFAATGLVGLAGAVRIGDGVWTGSTGVVDLETGEPFRADDFVRIASITKTYTATAVLQLVDEGAVSLDDLLETYVPGVINGDVATVADLLGMTSGIPDFTANEGFVERFTADPTLAWSDEDTLAVIAEAPGPDFAPGEKVAYCDSNYALLGMIIQEVTGQPAGEVITTKIIEPLGLTSTSYPTDVTHPGPAPDLLRPRWRRALRQRGQPAARRQRGEPGRAVHGGGDDLEAHRPPGVGHGARRGLAAHAGDPGPAAGDPQVRRPADQLRLRTRDHRPQRVPRPRRRHLRLQLGRLHPPADGHADRLHRQ